MQGAPFLKTSPSLYICISEYFGRASSEAEHFQGEDTTGTGQAHQHSEDESNSEGFLHLPGRMMEKDIVLMSDNFCCVICQQTSGDHIQSSVSVDMRDLPLDGNTNNQPLGEVYSREAEWWLSSWASMTRPLQWRDHSYLRCLTEMQDLLKTHGRPLHDQEKPENSYLHVSISSSYGMEGWHLSASMELPRDIQYVFLLFVIIKGSLNKIVISEGLSMSSCSFSVASKRMVSRAIILAGGWVPSTSSVRTCWFNWTSGSFIKGWTSSNFTPVCYLMVSQ